jgi:hypothetical protein
MAPPDVLMVGTGEYVGEAVPHGVAGTARIQTDQHPLLDNRLRRWQRLNIRQESRRGRPHTLRPTTAR